MKGGTITLGVILLFIVIGIIGWAVTNNQGNQTPSSTNSPSIMDSTSTADIMTTHLVTLATSQGDITLELYGNAAPATVASFIDLARQGFYDKTRFHRVIEGFMIQGGDPNTRDGANRDAQLGEPGAWGTGGPDYRFDDELVSNLSNVTGTIAMANSGRTPEGRGTNGSQFFINVADNTSLDGYTADGQPKACGTVGPQGWPISCHTVFGKVTSGMDVVMNISQTDTDPQTDRPLDDIIIESITVEEKA